MKTLLLSVLFLAFLITSSCQENRSPSGEKNAEGTKSVAAMLPADVLSLTKPLINGVLYNRPSFEGEKLARFDTSQQIQVLDTTDAMFVRARIAKDTSEYTGYVSKAILPEKR